MKSSEKLMEQVRALCSKCSKICTDTCLEVSKLLEKAGVEPVVKPNYFSKPIEDTHSEEDKVEDEGMSDYDREQCLQIIKELLPLVFHRKEERVQSRQFRAFIQCDPIAKVAEIAGISKQAMGERVRDAMQKIKTPIIDRMSKKRISTAAFEKLKHAAPPGDIKKTALPR